MAQKKKTTKTKKLHPGGSIPGRGAGIQMAVPGGTKGFRQRQTAPARRRNRMNLLAAMQRRRRRNNNTMPTAGMSQGRPAVGRTPMPGPAPDSARMRRMQQLMREQQARFNKTRPASTNQQLIDAARFPASNRRKKPTEAQRMAANDARRRRRPIRGRRR